MLKRIFSSPLSLLPLASLALGSASVSAAPLEKAVVSAPSINCLFASSCTITVQDIGPTVQRNEGGFFQSRVPLDGTAASPGEVGTLGEGLYLHLYRLDLRGGIPNPSAECVSEIEIPFGPHTPVDYDEDGEVDDFFEIQSGAAGNVAVVAADSTDGRIRLTYEGDGVCAGGTLAANGSSYFVGFASAFPPTVDAAELSFGTLTIPEIIPARVPLLPGDIPQQDYAFAWANLPTASSYTPSATYSYNRAGGAIDVSRSGVGRYRVTFEGMDTLWNVEGNAQVTAYDLSGASDTHCNTPGWGADWIDVECFDNLGVAVDSQFTALLSKPKPINEDIAYVRAAQPGSSSYSPQGADVHNPGGGPTTISRSSAGSYSVQFGGFTVPLAVGRGLGGNVQVTSMNSGVAHCSVSSRSSLLGAAGVECIDRFGNLTDAEFSLLWRMPRENFALDAAYVWANSASEPEYSPNFSFQYNPQNLSQYDPDIVTRLGIGRYQVAFINRLDGLAGPVGGHIQATAYGSDAARCEIRNWGGEFVRVDCFDETGAPADSRFSLLRLEPSAVPEPGISIMIMVGASCVLLFGGARPPLTRRRAR